MKVIPELPANTFSLYLPLGTFNSLREMFTHVKGESELYNGIRVFCDFNLPANRGCAWSRNEKGETELTLIRIGEEYP